MQNMKLIDQWQGGLHNNDNIHTRPTYSDLVILWMPNGA